MAASLKDSILRGDIPAGTPLRQDAIAERYGVSHIPVREALRHLAAEGLVTIRPNQGAIVRVLAPENARELLEIRALLEIQAIRWALPNADAEVLAAAEAALAESERTDDVTRWMQLNWAFHFTLYERAGRPRIFAMIQSLDMQIDRFIRVLISASDYRMQAQEEHRAILAAYRVRNEAAVVSLMQQHLDDTARSLVRLLEHYRPDGGETAAQG